MQTDTELSTGAGVTAQRPHQERRRNWWLVPRPIHLVSAGFYLGVLIPFLVNFDFGQEYHGEWWRAIAMICTITALLALDRLEYWWFGEETPTRAAIFLVLPLEMVDNSIKPLSTFFRLFFFRP